MLSRNDDYRHIPDANICHVKRFQVTIDCYSPLIAFFTKVEYLGL